MEIFKKKKVGSASWHRLIV